jgi:lantibiotic biosynthesis protein
MININTKFNEIVECLNEEKATTGDTSLLSGDLGMVLFNLHVQEYTKDSLLFDSAITRLEAILSSIVIEDSPFSFCTGIAGLGLFIEYIEKKKWLEIDTNEILEDIDEYLYHKMIDTIKIGNYDFLHGAIGVGFYFIHRNCKTTIAKKYLEELVLEIEKLAIIEDDGCMKWVNYLPGDNSAIETRYNIGLAHGIPSFLSFLVKVNQEGILQDKTLDMIRSTTKYILKTKCNFSEKYSTIPFTVNDILKKETTDTRLAWCYGDLGVCCSLWQAANLLKDDVLKQEVIKIILHAAAKRTIEQTRIIDAGICHGAAGAAFIFQRFYDWTQEPALKEAADYWYDKILEMGIFEDGYAGYKTFFTPELGGSRESYNMLDGISGVGLVLLYKISGLDPSWEELLFIR